MEFVHRIRGIERVFIMPVLHPHLVVPGMREVPHHARGWGGCSPMECERIAFLAGMMPASRDDEVLVQGPLADSGNEPFPDSRPIMTNRKLMAVVVPCVEIADHRDPG